MSSYGPLYRVASVTTEEQAAKIRASSLPWEAYRSANVISDEEFKLIREYDKRDTFVQNGLLDREGERYAVLFLSLLKKINNNDSIQYVLTLMDDMVEQPKRIHLFIAATNQDEALPFAPLMKCLEKDNPYITGKASKLLSAILCFGGKMKAADFDWFLNWLGGRLRSSSEEQVQSALASLQSLLQVEAFRRKYFETMEGVSRLVDILKSNRHQPNFQTQYQVIFCLWLLSFSKPIAEKLNNWKVIPVLVDVIKASLKEKVIRVALSTLRNMLEKAGEANMQAFSETKLLSLCQMLSVRKWTDEDIEADLEFLGAELEKNVHELTSFDEYATEVRSGALEWSPMHRSETFWKQNAARLNESNYELLRILAKLLDKLDTPQVVAIAAHDIGEYVTAYPRGKKVVQDLGAKEKIMGLMETENTAVRYEALLATQKFLVSNWEYLSKTTGQAAVTTPATAQAAN